MDGIYSCSLNFDFHQSKYKTTNMGSVTTSHTFYSPSEFLRMVLFSNYTRVNKLTITIGFQDLVAVTEDATTDGLVAVSVLGGLLDLLDDGLLGLDGGGWDVLGCRRCGGNVGLNGGVCGGWWCRGDVGLHGGRSGLLVLVATQLRNIGEGAGQEGNGNDQEFLRD